MLLHAHDLMYHRLSYGKVTAFRTTNKQKRKSDIIASLVAVCRYETDIVVVDSRLADRVMLCHLSNTLTAISPTSLLTLESYWVVVLVTSVVRNPFVPCLDDGRRSKQ